MLENKDCMTFDERWRALTITNDFIFGWVFSDKERCRKLIELLLGIKVKNLEVPQTQKSIKTSLISRGVRFDVYAEDNDRAFDIEIQTVNQRNWELRTRYYQSRMDGSLINQGQDYRDLKETYVIFLCCFDPVGLKECKYETVHVLKEHREYIIDDRRHIVLYNIHEYLKSEDEEQRAFFEYMATGNAGSAFSKEVQDNVDRAKTDDDLRSGVMTLEMEINMMKKDAKKEGIQEGIEKTRLENARNFKSLGVDIETIAKATGFTLEQVQAL
ncbi:MAG: Rpn family recombination-promoting nuclease/putative transposase [Spirochaetia bacterium]|nr:Rpn family recombination-promoting nuclease/putative transposase [Spirochaetia bacterium]